MELQFEQVQLVGLLRRLIYNTPTRCLSSFSLFQFAELVLDQSLQVVW